MIRVKITTMFPYSPLVRQTPGSLGCWGNCQFQVDHDDPECDCWVIYGGMREQVTAYCPQGNVILFDDEPPAVRTYDARFLAQFGAIISCQSEISHPRLIRGRQALPWHVGINRMNETTVLDYDALAAMTWIDKPKLLSVICSSKGTTPGHRLRLRFLEHLRNHFGARLDLFGRGFLPVGDKWEAVAPYKYHIALENSRVRHYISEKLTDSYLAGAYPLYHGCPNVGDYFSSRAYTPIDIGNPQRALATIDQAIDQRLYEARLKDIWAARDTILQRHNFFGLLAEVCAGLPLGRLERTTIRPEWTFKTPASALHRAKANVRRLWTHWSPPPRRAA